MWEDNIKMDLKTKYSGHRLVSGCVKRSGEPSRYINGEQFLLYGD
jgi:hypothetical protein